MEKILCLFFIIVLLLLINIALIRFFQANGQTIRKKHIHVNFGKYQFVDCSIKYETKKDTVE